MNIKLTAFILFLSSQIFQVQAQEQKWISLFNGKTLEGWTPKIKGHKAGVNHKNTFVVKDGVLAVNYSEYDHFDNDFGHIFYKEKFSNYILRMDYRIVGEQLKGGPDWGYRNNGIMLHSQSPESMGVDQFFPRSIEVQFLSGDADAPAKTGNVCTPGTHIIMEGELITEHCIDSNSKPFSGENWVSVEVEVRNNHLIRHKINGDIVLEYSGTQFDADDNETPAQGNATGTPLTEGYIALQAESHPTEFRNIMLLNLDQQK